MQIGQTQCYARWMSRDRKSVSNHRQLDCLRNVNQHLKIWGKSKWTKVGKVHHKDHYFMSDICFPHMCCFCSQDWASFAVSILHICRITGKGNTRYWLCIIMGWMQVVHTHYDIRSGSHISYTIKPVYVFVKWSCISPIGQRQNIINNIWQI